MKNYGFEPSKIEVDHYILGGAELPKVTLQPLGNWEQYLPKYEPQFENFETSGCTVWGTQNAIETLIKRIEFYEPNYSERFTYILAGVRPPGADPHKVAECIRKDGLVDETLLPTDTQTFDDFIKPYPMTKDLIDEGEKWLNKYDFGHEWLWTNGMEKSKRTILLREYLQYSPVCVSVSAWSSDANNLYYSAFPNNHWCMCYGLEGDSLLVFDSYSQEKKKLHPDHEVLMCKRYHIGKSTRQAKLTLIESILKWIQEQIWSIPKSVDKPISNPLDTSYNEVKEKLMEKDYLTPFCNAIAEFEGGPGDLNHKNNNPGNLRSVKGPFLKFKTWEEGMTALRDYITRAATGKHKAYKPEFTISQFFSVYAPASDDNHPYIYAKFVTNKVGIPVTFQIKDLV